MEILSARQAVLQNTVVTVGSFDGLHLGHQAILRLLVREAGRLKAKSVVFTFGDHPRLAARGEPVLLISSPEERREILAGLGVDYLVVADEPDIFDYSAEEFVKHFLCEKLDARLVLMGFNFRFGKDRRGTPEFLQKKPGRWGSR